MDISNLEEIAKSDVKVSRPPDSKKESVKTIKGMHEISKPHIFWAIAPLLMFLGTLIGLIYALTAGLEIVWGILIAVFISGYPLVGAEKLYYSESSDQSSFKVETLAEFYFFQGAKAVAYLISICGLLIVMYLLFAWLGTISIAPNTIIIFLLFMILVKQNERK